MPEVGPLEEQLGEQLLSGSLVSNPNVLIADMVSEEGEWHWELFEQLILDSILLRIAAVKCHLPHFLVDLVRWAGTQSGKFMVRSAYGIRNGIEEGPDEDV
ncbi:hypothetical protein V6N11_044257 [Hibiscus sabdariffa]|uniref:Uncharacterized protein n=1 Tax=Hibiscus sabdariffa TaxID=183260 RepID=A0ABR2RF37_9ROSI